MKRPLTLLLTILLIPTPSAAQPLTAFVVGGERGKTASRKAVNVLKKSPVDLHLVVRQGRGRRARYFTDAPVLRVGRRRVSKRRMRPLSALGATQIQWWRVEPHMHHVDTPSPNGKNPAYSNCVLFGRSHGKWLGYDNIEYHETRIKGGTGGTLTVVRADPTDRRLAVNRGLGTMRYKVSFSVRGQVASTPGMESVAAVGIRDNVMRVSFRSGDDLVGHLSAYFNVPNLFGSAGKGKNHQTERFQGADCADVIVGAARLAGARVPYTSVAGLYRHTRTITGPLTMARRGITDETGAPVRLRIGRDVRLGDLMVIDYASMDATRRRWDHIGVLAEDRGIKGVLDPEDVILHQGFLTGLRAEAAHRQGTAVIQFLRFRRL